MSGARKAADKGFAQAKDTLERGTAAASEAASAVESGYAAASRTVKEYNVKLIEIARASLNATFDLSRDLAQVRSPSEFIELSSGHARRQLEMLTRQASELGEFARRMAAETAEPLKAGVRRMTDAAA
jgi:phasin